MRPLRQEMVWNPWHGCHKYSEGCAHCYMFRRDESIGKDPTRVERTKSFQLIIARDRKGRYKVPSGTLVYVCMTSDFLIEEADGWRPEIWQMMADRPDLDYMIITKRIVRLKDMLPPDWGGGWPNVAVACTIENQRQYDFRYPIFRDLPIAHKFLACEPLLGPITMLGLDHRIEGVVAGGESGNAARSCDFDWFLDLYCQCLNVGVSFTFRQTGARLKKNGITYRIPRRRQHEQARKAGLDTEL